MKIIDLFEFPPKDIFLPVNQYRIKQIEEQATTNLQAVDMLLDAGIITASDYYNLDDWFWTLPKSRIKQIINRRKATII